jgi:hypothetical protein
MNIEQAVDISYIASTALKVSASVAPLELLEEVMVKAGLEEGSFGIFRVTYADDISEVYFHYPTDMDEQKALEFAMIALEF